MELTSEEALQKGIEAQRAGQIQEADRLYTAILKAHPKHPDVNHNMGVLAVGVGKIQEALPFFKKAIESNGSIGQFWLSYINALMSLGLLSDAKAVLDQARDKGASGEAFDQLEQQFFGTSANQQDPPSHQLQPIINLCIQGQLQEALSYATEMLEGFPNSAILYNISGASYTGLMQFDSAIDSFNMALKIKPDYADACNNMGLALNNKGDPEAAIDSYIQALKIKPDYAEVYNNMGLALNDKGDSDAAINSYKQALKIKPDYADVHNNMGLALNNKGEPEAAVDSYNKAIKVKPDFAEAFNNRGIALNDMGNPKAAIDSYKKALKVNPDYADVHNNMGNLFQENHQYRQAKQSFDQITRQLSEKGLKVYKTDLIEPEGSISSNPDVFDTTKLHNALNLARQKSKDGQFEKANIIYEDILQQCSKNKKAIASIKLIATRDSLTGNDNKPTAQFLNPTPIDYEELYRPGMGTENVGGFLRAMLQMVRPNRILEIGAGYTTPFLLEGIVNNIRVFNDGNLELSYFGTPYIYDPKLVVIDDMSLGKLAEKPGMEKIITSKYVDFVTGKFEDQAGALFEKYGNFDFVWFDCGGAAEYKVFMDKYWDIISGYIFFHFTYSDGKPNIFHSIIREKMKGDPLFFDIVEPHKKRQGSVTMIKKH